MAYEHVLWERTLAEVESSGHAVLCTVIHTHGSSPRESGTRMVMGTRGTVAGTVGGGCAEAEVAVLARKLLAGHAQARQLELDLAGDLNDDQAQQCGGTMSVFVERMDKRDLATLKALVQAERGAGGWVVSRISSDDTQIRLAFEQTSQAVMQRIGGDFSPEAVEDKPALIDGSHGRFFVQFVGRSEALFIVGSGHVAVPLSDFALRLGYRVTVIDDRPEYASREHFSGAAHIEIGEHAQLLARQPINAQSSIVIVTRGHRHDELALRAALATHARYIGMIGSKRRAIETLKRLAADGFDPGRLADVRTPVGLDIGAQSPEEIALAIMAEVVACRRGGSGMPLRDRRPGGGTQPQFR